MKKLASILVLVFAITFTTQAQKKRGGNGERGPKLTAEQQATLAVKKMALTLDLSEKQQNQIKPILISKMEERKASMEKRKANKERKEDRKKPTADEMFAMQSKRLDKKIAEKKEMQNILSKEQFEKFEKMHKKRNKMAMHKNKGSKNNKRDQRGRRS